MSLIVAKIINNHIRIESDSRIMLNNYAEGHFLGRVKAVIISPEFVVSSAGNIYYFEKALKTIRSSETKLGVEEILQILLNENISSNDTTSFLFCITGQQNEIIRVEDSKIERNLLGAWLGDKSGFEKFQWHYFPVSQSGLVKKLGLDFIMWESFKGVIGDENIESVGDIQVSIVSGNERFAYNGIGTSEPSMKSVDENMKQGIYPFEGVPLMLSAKNGDYEAKFIPSTDGLSFGIYYTFGEFGIFISPYLTNSFSIIRNASLDNFYKRIQEEFNTELVRKK